MEGSISVCESMREDWLHGAIKLFCYQLIIIHILELLDKSTIICCNFHLSLRRRVY